MSYISVTGIEMTAEGVKTDVKHFILSYCLIYSDASYSIKSYVSIG